MRIYEELFILDPKAPDEVVDAVVGQIEDVVTSGGGKIDKVDRWGVRKLAYRVKKREEGLYILVQFTAAAETVRELERRLRVDENVLKYITVRIDEMLKWLEKRKKIREKRAARKPQSVQQSGPRGGSRPGAPAPGAPGAPAKEEPAKPAAAPAKAEAPAKAAEPAKTEEPAAASAAETEGGSK
jgi:small subunit ribosomal protein S6